MMKRISGNPVALAMSESGDDMSLYQLHKVYDGSGRYEVFKVNEEGNLIKLRRGGVRFEGTLDAVIRLFRIWACEVIESCRVCEFHVPIQRGDERSHAKKNVAGHKVDSHRRSSSEDRGDPIRKRPPKKR